MHLSIVNILQHPHQIAALEDLPMLEGSSRTSTNEVSVSKALEEEESASKAVETSCNFMVYAKTSVEEREQMEAMEQ